MREGENVILHLEEINMVHIKWLHHNDDTFKTDHLCALIVLQL